MCSGSMFDRIQLTDLVHNVFVCMYGCVRVYVHACSGIFI